MPMLKRDLAFFIRLVRAAEPTDTSDVVTSTPTEEGGALAAWVEFESVALLLSLPPLWDDPFIFPANLVPARKIRNGLTLDFDVSVLLLFVCVDEDPAESSETESDAPSSPSRPPNGNLFGLNPPMMSRFDGSY